MGSNKSNTNSTMGSAWKFVQNGSNASAFGNDEDDSTGMAWVKKRRAERENAKLEAEKRDQEHGNAVAEQPHPAIAKEEEQETPRSPKEDPHPPIDAPTVTPADQPHGGPEHVTTAVNLPPQRLHKRESSLSRRVQIPQAESPAKPSPSVDDIDLDLDQRPELTPEPPEASTVSTSEDEDPSSSDEDDDESDAISEVCIPLFSMHVSLDNFVCFRRRMRIARRPWALVSRKSADIRTHLSRRPPICPTPL